MIMPSPFTVPPAGAGIYDNMRTAVEAVFVGRTRAYNRRFLELSARTISSIRSPGLDWQTLTASGTWKPIAARLGLTS
jgi:hypothetical protein